MASVKDRPIDARGMQGTAWPAELLQSVWSEQQPLIAARIGSIERATAALEDGHLGELARAEAQRAAHMLAGSLGIFGSHDASRAAHELELALLHPAREQAPAMRNLLACISHADHGPLVEHVDVDR